MAYIGRDTDKLSNIEVLDAITFDGSSSYTLQKNSVNFTPSSANNVLVSIDGVVQANNFTVSGSTINFGVAVPSTSTCDWIYHIGVGLITTPADGTVSLAKLSATGTKDATTFLRGDNTFSTLPASGITEADQWRLTTTFTGDANPLSSNLERVDSSGWGKLGTGMSVSSGIWTFPSTGIWLIKFHIISFFISQNRYATGQIHVTTDNSNYNSIASSEQGITDASANVYAHNLTETLVDVTNTSNVKVKFVIDCENNGTSIVGDTSVSFTHMMFIRLGDT